jgi:hypothetical protein
LLGKWLGNEEVKDSFGKQLMSDLVSHSSSPNLFVGHFFNVLQYVSVQFLLPPPKPPTQQYVSGFDADLDVQWNYRSLQRMMRRQAIDFGSEFVLIRSRTLAYILLTTNKTSAAFPLGIGVCANFDLGDRCQQNPTRRRLANENR